MEAVLSREYLFALVVLTAFQKSKFSEIGKVEILGRNLNAVLKLQASDFVTPQAFRTALVAYLAATAILFTVICLLPPEIVKGWGKIVGVEISEADISSVSYPLYLAAIYVGLSQTKLPGLSGIVAAQRGIFHHFIGVPRRVVNTSAYFASQYVAKSADLNEIKEQLRALTSRTWIRKIDPYADIAFYRAKLLEMELFYNEDIEKALQGSEQSIIEKIDDLIFFSALATARESGGGDLYRLAADLQVESDDDPGSLPAMLACAVLGIMTFVVLWLTLPLIKQVAEEYGLVLSDLWPDDMSRSGGYLAAHIAPMFLAIWLTLSRSSLASLTINPTRPVRWVVLERHASTLLLVLMVVCAFDYLQTLYALGAESDSQAVPSADLSSTGASAEAPHAAAQAAANVSSPLQGQIERGFAFFTYWLPYISLHALISVIASYFILAYGTLAVKLSCSPKLAYWIFRALPAVGVLSGLYAVVRLIFQYDDLGGITNYGYVVLVVLLNLVSGGVGLVAASIYFRRVLPRQQNSQLQGLSGQSAPYVAT